MINQTGTNEFWEVGQVYKHMSYDDKFECVGFTDTHTKLKSCKSNLRLEVPKCTRHMAMYKTKPYLGH